MSDTWIDSIYLIVFIASVWLVGDLCKYILIPPIIGEILVGVLLGPKVADFVPFVDVEGSAFSALGNIGIALLLAHSGLHVDISKIKQIGIKAVLIGIIGTIIPVSLGTLFFWLIGFNAYPEAIVCAIAITPASVGVSMRVLLSLNRLNTIYGQSIMIGALTDDFLAIILLIIIKTVIFKKPTFKSTGLPLIGALLFISGSLILTRILPKYINKLIRRSKVILTKDKKHIVLLLIFIFGFSVIGDLVGSFLLGSFLAGFMFSEVRRSILLWRKEIKPYMSWLLRLFFASTVAFTIPVEILFSIDVFWKGVVIACICVISKLLSALHLGDDKWIVGWAIVSRGEFSFLIGEFAESQNIITKNEYGIIVWGLVLSTLVGPMIFQYLVKKRKESIDLEQIKDYYQIVVEGKHHDGIHAEIITTINFMGYYIRDATIETDDKYDSDIMLIKKSGGGQITYNEMCEIKKELEDVIDDDDVKIIFVSLDKIEIGDVSIHVTGENVRMCKDMIKTYLKKEYKLTVFENSDFCISEGNIDSLAIISRGLNKIKEKDINEISLEIKKIVSLKDPTSTVVVKLDSPHKSVEIV